MFNCDKTPVKDISFSDSSKLQALLKLRIFDTKYLKYHNLIQKPWFEIGLPLVRCS